MTGLDKIINQIENEAKENADKIIAEAEEKASEIISTAEKKAAEITSEYAKKAETECAAITARAASADALEIKKSILSKKQSLIKDAVKNAESAVYNLPDSEYFDIILKTVKKYAPNKNGVMMFGKKDLDRLPNDFEKTINATLGFENTKLVISDKTADIDGGFILNYGGIEENCSFKALFDSAAEELSDKALALLFE